MFCPKRLKRNEVVRLRSTLWRLAKIQGSPKRNGWDLPRAPATRKLHTTTQHSQLAPCYPANHSPSILGLTRSENSGILRRVGRRQETKTISVCWGLSGELLTFTSTTPLPLDLASPHDHVTAATALEKRKGIQLPDPRPNWAFLLAR